MHDYIIGMDSDNLLTLKVKIPVQSLRKQILFKNAENFQIALKAWPIKTLDYLGDLFSKVTRRHSEINQCLKITNKLMWYFCINCKK